MTETSRNADPQAETPLLATPGGMEQSLLLWRVRKELARLQRIGDWQAYQAMLDVVVPVLGEPGKAQKKRQP